MGKYLEVFFTAYPWVALILGGLAPFFSGLFVFLQWWFGRRDKQQETAKSDEEVRREKLDKLQEQLNGEGQRVLDNLRKEFDRATANCDREAKNADRWETIARGWHSWGQDLHFKYRVLRHDCAADHQWIRSAVIKFPELENYSPPKRCIPDRPPFPSNIESILEKEP